MSKLVTNLVEAFLFTKKRLATDMQEPSPECGRRVGVSRGGLENRSVPNQIKAEILLLKRRATARWGGIWQGISGKIEDDEPAVVACLREIKEETGLSIKRLYVLDYVNSFYNPATDELFLGPFFAGEVIAKSAIKLSPEHTEYRWVTYAEAQKLVIWRGYHRALKSLREDILLVPEVNPLLIAFEKSPP